MSNIVGLKAHWPWPWDLWPWPWTPVTLALTMLSLNTSLGACAISTVTGEKALWPRRSSVALLCYSYFFPVWCCWVKQSNMRRPSRPLASWSWHLCAQVWCRSVKTTSHNCDTAIPMFQDSRCQHLTSNSLWLLRAGNIKWNIAKNAVESRQTFWLKTLQHEPQQWCVTHTP